MSASKGNIQYPAQTGPYKVFVKDKGWREYKTVRLQISVGNPKHTGEKFFALCEWAAARFDRVILIVSDTLQRHNLALKYDISAENARLFAQLNGCRWVKENKAALSVFKSGQMSITLWNDWLSHKDYAATLQDINTFFTADPAFRTAVEDKAHVFTAKIQAQDPLVSYEDYFNASVSFLLEELAAFSVMFRETSALDVYPGSWVSSIFAALKDVDTLDSLAVFGKAKCLSVDFTRNKISCEKAPVSDTVQVVTA